MNRYLNPFTENQPAYYENDARCVMDYRGYRVYKLTAQAFDVVKNGVCVTQRAGYSKNLIDRIADDADMYTAPDGPRR